MSKKELIRISAIDLFATKGFHNTSTPMIAEAAQISIGTIYNYFKNKEEILDYIFLVEYEIRKEFLLILDKKDIPITDKIMLFIDKLISLIKESPNCTKVILEGIMNPQNRNLEYVHKFRCHLAQLLTDMLSFAHQKGEISGINPGLVGPAIFFSIRRVAYSFQATMVGKEYDIAIEELKNFINSALLG